MKSWRDHWPALWLLLILVLVGVVRVRLLSLPLERDEGEYAYAGQLMLEGVPPYKLVYNMKMPGIYAAYALILAIFGQSPAGIRLGFMLVNFGAIVLLYFVGRRFLGRAGAVAASAVYALMSMDPRVHGLNAHATHFVVLAALGGILLLLRAQESGRLPGFFWSGALFGLAFLLKQPGGAFGMFGFTLLLWTACRQRPADWRTHGARLALYAAGVIGPILLTLLILWRAGVWDKFWWWTFTYARVHATALPWKFGKLRLAYFFMQDGWERLFWGLAVAGLLGLLIGKGRTNEKIFFLSCIFFSVAAVCPTLHFTGHYFVLLLPVVALLAARTFATLAAWLTTQPLTLVRHSPWILLGLAWAGIAWSHLDVFLIFPPDVAAAWLYPGNDFQVYPLIADYLNAHAPPSATFAVIGSEPELPFYAHRRSVTGYLYMYDLVQEQPFRERMEKEMISEVEHGRPDYIFFVNLVYSWEPNPPERYDQIWHWFSTYAESQYEPCGVVTFPPNQYIWGADRFRRVPMGHRFIMIYQRKHPAPAAGAATVKSSTTANL